jgi:hypothetical protein
MAADPSHALALVLAVVLVLVGAVVCLAIKLRLLDDLMGRTRADRGDAPGKPQAKRRFFLGA